MGTSSAFAVVVKIVHVVRGVPVASRQVSHSPAKANGGRPCSAIYMGVLVEPFWRHSKKPSASTRQRRRCNACRKLGFSATVSTRALIVRCPLLGSLAQEGTNPHRKYPARLCVPSLSTVSICWPGAML